MNEAQSRLVTFLRTTDRDALYATLIAFATFIDPSASEDDSLEVAHAFLEAFGDFALAWRTGLAATGSEEDDRPHE